MQRASCGRFDLCILPYTVSHHGCTNRSEAWLPSCVRIRRGPGVPRHRAQLPQPADERMAKSTVRTMHQNDVSCVFMQLSRRCTQATCRFCEYPQEIGIQFLEGVCLVSQMQFLSHQSKIATRIEIFTGVGNDYFRCPFTRLGYLSLDSNTASGHKVRSGGR